MGPALATASVSASFSGSVARRAPRRGADAVLHLQRTAGNRAVTRLLQRQPAQKARPVDQRLERLGKLARWPNDAHLEWKKLSTGDKFTLIELMARRYGSKFADQFRDTAQRGAADRTLHYSQPGMGPTPAQLTSRGWRFVEMEVTGTGGTDVEVWVHASGQIFRRDVSGKPPQQTKPPEIPPPEEECEDKLKKILDELWRAMADYEAAVERVEANPADRAKLDAEVATKRNLTRSLITKVSDLKTVADEEEDEECADKASEAWGSAMEQYTNIGARYSAVP